MHLSTIILRIGQVCCVFSVFEFSRLFCMSYILDLSIKEIKTNAAATLALVRRLLYRFRDIVKKSSNFFRRKCGVRLRALSILCREIQKYND